MREGEGDQRCGGVRLAVLDGYERLLCTHTLTRRESRRIRLVE